MTEAQNCAKHSVTAVTAVFQESKDLIQMRSECRYRLMLFLTYLGNDRQGSAHTGLKGERGQKSAGGTSLTCSTVACPDI